MAIVGVTGAAGFIGGALVPYLAHRGHELRLFDNFTGPLRVENPGFPVERADLREAQSLGILEGVDVVLHLAAVSGVMACAQHPATSRVVNVDATRRLVTWCWEKHIPLAFASSFAVVGIPATLPITERTPARPTHEYARQKAEGETIVGQSGGTPVAILRMSNVYGRYRLGDQTIAKGNVLNLFADQAAKDRTLRVNAPGTQRRDFIHLIDVLAHWEAAVRFLTAESAPPGRAVFNVASGESATMLDLAERVREHWLTARPERPLRIETVPNPRAAIELLQPEFAVDRSWTERALGVRCTHTLEGSIDEILAGSAEPID